MLLILLSAAVLAVLFLVLWSIRGGSQHSVDDYAHPRFYAVDVAAFRNLLSPEEDDFLQNSLTTSSYRTVRRARLRAVQEYLLWIAANCATLIAILRLRISQPEPESAVDTENIVRGALKLRLLSLGFWLLLWIEFILPGVQIRPFAAVRRYEDVWRFAQNYFRAHLLEPVVTSPNSVS